jgi:exosortase/archaeosortase family protein
MPFMKKRLTPGLKQFLAKSTIFIISFALFSALIGTKLYTDKMLYDSGIYIYGRVGYILLFSIVGFILVYREKISGFEAFRHKPKDFILLALSFILLAVFYIIELNIERISFNWLNIALIHLIGVSIFVFLALGIYGLNFTGHFFKQFKKETGYFLVFGIITASLMDFVWKLWPYLSAVVLKITYFLLKLISSTARVVETDTLFLGSFAAKIGEACSGIYSIFIFSSLYLFAVFLDWKKLNKSKVSLLFIPAVLGAFLVNVLRVFLLMIIGAYVSREIALGLYHSYIGMIFFLIYFIIFWLASYKWMKN